MRTLARLWKLSPALTMITVLASAGCGTDSGTTSAPPAAAKPTIVLVHGSFSDSSSWDAVAGKLRAQGYPVVQPDNPLRGPGADAAAITKAIEKVDGPIVLVGHSYGGAVISNIHRPSVKAEVFVAGFSPVKGEPVQALSDPRRYPGSKIGTAIQVTPGAGGVEVTLAPERFAEVFAHDVDAGTATRLAARQRPTSGAANAEPSGDPSWSTVPTWYLVSAEDQILPPASQRFQAQRMRARTSEVKSSHASPVSHPSEVAEVIIAAAR